MCIVNHFCGLPLSLACLFCGLPLSLACLFCGLPLSLACHCNVTERNAYLYRSVITKKELLEEIKSVKARLPRQ